MGLRIQKRLPKGQTARLEMSSSLMKATRDEVEATARLFGVSKSFVIAVALADFFGIKKQERYDVPREVKKRKRA